MKRLKYVKSVMIVIAVFLFMLFFSGSADKENRDTRSFEKKLVAFWNFSEEAGQSRISKKGMRQFALLEGNGEISRVAEGLQDGYSARIEDGKWFYIPRDSLYELNIYGENAQVTVIAWVKKYSNKDWQAVGGVWDETRSKRQYYLFLNASKKVHQDEMKRYPSKDLVHGHISSIGGVTPGEKACITYASSKDPVPVNQWAMIAMTYDSEFIKVYIDGRLSNDEKTNPFRYDTGIFNGGDNGADFTIGANSVRNTMTNQFIGLIDGLAVFNKALSEDEIFKIYKYGI